LRSQSSIALGLGRTCARKVRLAAQSADLTVYKPAQIVKAIELVELAAIVRNGATWTAVASNGIDRYDVVPYSQTCTCPAEQKGRRCYHLLAATAIAAA
jgi:hypothetical protein